MFGIGLRNTHYPYLEEQPKTNVDFFEAISENYMNSFGRPLEILELIRRDYPVSLHGVSMNVGSTEEINYKYLDLLNNLIKRIDPFIISDHICFTGKNNKNLHNLLPLRYDQETVNYVSDKIIQIQDYLKRPLLIENLSAYLTVQGSTFEEWDFVREVAIKSDCHLLLDINNIYVNAINHKFDPQLYLDAIPKEKVKEIHLAGYSELDGFLFDTHSNPVFPGVWELYKSALNKFKNVPTLLEWDEDIPDFDRVEEEMLKAKKISEEHHE